MFAKKNIDVIIALCLEIWRIVDFWLNFRIGNSVIWLRLILPFGKRDQIDQVSNKVLYVSEIACLMLSCGYCYHRWSSTKWSYLIAANRNDWWNWLNLTIFQKWTFFQLSIWIKTWKWSTMTPKWKLTFGSPTNVRLV